MKQETTNLRFIVRVCIAVGLGAPGLAYGQEDPVRRVDQNATGAETGLTWQDAYVYLQDALEEAGLPGSPVEQIWVAQGTYFPDDGLDDPPTNPREATFQLLSQTIK